MKRYLKKLAILTCLLMTFLLVCGYNYDYGLGGCGKEDLVFSVCGDFVIDQNNEVHDFTDEAILKEEIYIPTTINGKPFTVFSARKGGGLWGSGHIVMASFRKGNIKRIYMFTQEESGLTIDQYASLINNLNFAITSTHTIDYKYELYEGVFDGYPLKRTTQKVSFIFNKNSKFIDEVCLVDTYSAMQSCLDETDGRIKAGKLSVDYYGNGSINFVCSLANIQYMYNYQNAPNNGHYYIDSVNSEELIEKVPSAPTREGFAFGGWYADSECTIPYDFNKEITRKTLIGVYEEEYTGTKFKGAKLYYSKDYVTYIYAKWI